MLLRNNLGHSNQYQQFQTVFKMEVKLFISILYENISLLIILIKLTLIKYDEYFLEFFSKFKKFIFEKRRLLFFIKIFFLFVTLYHCIVMSIDYLEFKYRYNLIVEDNSEGFEWKPLSVCTESKVLFDKQNLIQYFNLTEVYYKYENKNYKGNLKTPKIEFGKMNRISKFFAPFVNKIFDEFDFVEMSSLRVDEKELFECSAKIHFNNPSNNSFAMEMENCFEKFEIKSTIIANNTFGICYEFFETNSPIFLKEEDFIKIQIKIRKQTDFIMYHVNRKMFIDGMDIPKFYQYFRWYYFINDVKSIASKTSLITSTRIGLSAELKISKTSIEMLSVPYMTFCEHFQCRHVFYKIKLDNDIFNYNYDSELVIKNNRKKNLIYNAEPSLEFVNFISNIGGLFGLYFGLSFIDLSNLMKLITRKLTFYLQRLIFYQKIKVLIEYLKLSSIKILQYIKRITKLPWKLILTFLSSPFFVSQMLNLVISYFQYSTQISFEFVEYQQKNQKISINEFPAITVCTEHMFDKAFFDKFYIYYNQQSFVIKYVAYSIEGKFETNQSSNDHSLKNTIDTFDCWPLVHHYQGKLNSTNKNIRQFILLHCKNNYEYKIQEFDQFLSKYFDINNEEEYYQVIRRIEDKHMYGLNGTLDLLDFYVNHHNCWTLYEPNIECEDLKPTIKMLSPLGKCHTYLMGDNDNQTYVDKIELSTGDPLGELRTHLRRKFILHSSNHLPIWTSNQFRATDIQFNQENSFVVRIDKNQFIKLPPPYDQKCHDYSESQQFECLNKCIVNYYNQKFKCYPNTNNYYSIMVDNQTLNKNFIFCNESEYISKKSKLFAQTCQIKCGEPCSKTYYTQNLFPITLKFLNKLSSVYRSKVLTFIFDNVDYLRIIWLPQLTIISLFIKIVNIWSLWHGIHFELLIDLILDYVKQFNSWILQRININLNSINNINYEIAKVRNYQPHLLMIFFEYSRKFSKYIWHYYFIPSLVN